MKTLNAALAAACLLVAPSAAMAATAQDVDNVEISVLAPAQHSREPIELRVSTAGLDLSNPQNLERLRARVTKAIAAACNPGGRINADLSPDWQCRREMGANATTALYTLARQGAPKHLASN
ncbi:MAG: UrcA family protein [Sphingomonas sp.]